MQELATKKCTACREGTPPVKGEKLKELLSQLKGWSVVDEHHLTRTYKFKDFAGALAFVNKVGTIAEAEDHHPDICFGWGKVKIDLWTHKIGGLSESDFILAAKVDQIPAE
jgi:4a-hydroxytetrahydrobiopterin dehydratase